MIKGIKILKIIGLFTALIILVIPKLFGQHIEAAQSLLASAPDKAYSMAKNIADNTSSNDTLKADALSIQGSALRRLKKLDLAIEKHKQALSLREKLFGNKNIQVANSMTNLGRCFFEKNAENFKNLPALDTAINYFKTAINIENDEILNPDDHEQLLTNFLFLSKAYSEKGAFVPALKFIRNANTQIDRRDLSHPINNSLQISVRDQFAKCLRYTGDTDGAVENYKNAINICLKYTPNDNEMLAGFHYNIASCYFDRKADSAALFYAQKSLALIDRKGSNYSNSIELRANILNKIGDCYFRMQKTEKAAVFYKKSQLLLSENKTPKLIALSYLNAAKILNAQHDYKNALSEIENAIRILSVKDTTQNLSLELLSAFTEKANTFFEIANQSNVAANFLNAENAYEKAITFLEHTELQTGNQASGLLLRGYFYEIFGGAAEVCFRQKKMGKAFYFSEKEKSYWKQKPSQGFKPCEGCEAEKNFQNILPAIQKKLSDHQIVIEYCFGRKTLMAFKISKNNFEAFGLPIENIEQNIEQVYKKISTNPELNTANNRDFSDEAFELYNKLVEPLHLPENFSLVIIPDGVLHYLPFEILITQKPIAPQIFKNYDYLIKKYPISYVNSIALLSSEEPQKEKFPSSIIHYPISKQILSFAPSFENHPAHLEALKYNETEIDAVHKIWQSEKFTGAAATKNNFINAARNFKILHLATHGINNSVYPENSFLAFTAQSDTVENALLYADEINNLKLNTELVVLSACETATGPLYNGEGLMSLSRSFLASGVQSVIASHWNVDDKQTTRLMPLVYKYLKNGLPKDVALQKAKLQFIEESNGFSAHPFYWAAFSLSGNSSPITNNADNFKKYGLLMFVFAAILIFIWLKRKNNF